MSVQGDIELKTESIESFCSQSKDVICNLKEWIWQREDEKKIDPVLVVHLISHCSDIPDEYDIREELRQEYENMYPSLSSIHGTNIEWNEGDEGMPLQDTILMETLDKCFYNGKTHQEVIATLETLL